VRPAAILVFAALLAGCTAAGGDYPRSRYIGAPVEQFFLEWGAPVAQHKLKHGWKMYLWYTGRDSVYLPGHTDSELIGNTAWWKGYRLKDFYHRLECGVRIVTSPDGTIQEILVHEDSRGWWEFQRCREVFGPAVEAVAAPVVVPAPVVTTPAPAYEPPPSSLPFPTK
jgi:hypothetical protein